MERRDGGVDRRFLAGAFLAFAAMVTLGVGALVAGPATLARGMATVGAVLAFATGLMLALVPVVRARLVRKRRASVGSARDFLDALPVAVFVLDRRGRPSYANALARRMLGKGILPTTKPDDLSVVYPSFYAGTNTPYPAEKMPIVRALEGEEGVVVDDVEIEGRGKRTPIEARAGPVRDDSGDIQGSIAVFHDITGRREAERERARRIERDAQLREARAYEALRSGFVNRAAHDLFTPMTPMRIDLTTLRTLIDEKGGEDHKGAHRRLTRNLERLHDVAKHLLQVAQLEADQARLQLSSVDLAALVRDETRALSASADSPGRKWKVQLPDHVWIEGDPLRLSTALRNVLAGAVRIAGAQGALDVVLSKKDNAVLEVHARGRPIGEDEVRHFFEPFWDKARGGSLEGGGLGLGLFVSRAIVRAHGGSATATAKADGSGTVIRWTLPLIPAPEAGAGPAVGKHARQARAAESAAAG